MTAKLAFIAAHACDHAIRLLCRVPGVSRSWFHAWQGAAADRVARAARHDALIDEIRSIFEDSKQRHGAPCIHAELRDRDHQVSRKTVAKLMKQNGIRPPRRKRRMPVTKDSRHGYGIAPNLLDRNFAIAAPDRVWLADISYIPTDEGWLYLAAIKDLGTMEIVGWSMSERLKGTRLARMPGRWPSATGGRQEG